MNNKAWYFAAALLCVFPCRSTLAAEETKQASFTQAVIHQAISFMPGEVKTKLSAVEKNIVAGAKPVLKAGRASAEPYYYVDKEEGTGPAALAEQFRIARKNVRQKATYSVLAPVLGRLARVTVALCQPYHTSESAFKSPKHAAFEKALDAASASLKADFDGNQQVDNPSEFGVRLAERANGLLTKLNSAEGEGSAAIQSAVFALASNGVADCWWTLLVAEKTKSEEGIPPTANYIGNKRSLKFHLPTCRWLPLPKNRVYLRTREEAISEGFVPCKVCRP